MDWLFELLWDVITEIANDPRMPKWIRYPCIALAAVLVVAVITALVGGGILLWKAPALLSKLCGTFLILVALVLTILTVKRVKKKRG